MVDIIFPCLNFPFSFLNGKSNQNKQCQQIPVFCLISFFLKFQTKLFEILENITSCLGIYKYQSYHEFFENLKKWNQTKTWYLLTLFILVWFTHQKRRGKIQTGENHVHQGLSKVFVFYTYSSIYLNLRLKLNFIAPSN